MNKAKVLVVDDSVVIRKVITIALADQPDIEVIGTAPSGRIALAKIRQCRPDIITLDMEMPDMNGLETLDALREFPDPPKVILCSALTTQNGPLTLDALAKGASDYVTKPSGLGMGAHTSEEFQSDLLGKIRALMGAQPQPRGSASQSSALHLPETNRGEGKRIEVVAIGVSTGGPNALAALFADLPSSFPVPIVLVQHMPPFFTKSLAERLTGKGPIPVEEGTDGCVLTPGRAWLAPGDFHMQVAWKDSQPVLRLNQGAPENSCRPAVDVLFRSVAETYGAAALAVVLTGMGQDGLQGCRAIREAGGEIFVQDEASSVVWGMPGQVAKAGLANRVMPLRRMAEALRERALRGRLGL